MNAKTIIIAALLLSTLGCDEPNRAGVARHLSIDRFTDVETATIRSEYAAGPEWVIGCTSADVVFFRMRAVDADDVLRTFTFRAGKAEPVTLKENRITKGDWPLMVHDYIAIGRGAVEMIEAAIAGGSMAIEYDGGVTYLGHTAYLGQLYANLNGCK